MKIRKLQEAKQQGAMGVGRGDVTDSESRPLPVFGIISVEPPGDIKKDCLS